MAKDKDKQQNPAALARKAEKAKSIKKGKAAITQQRNTRLSKQNPHRIQSQIDDLKALEANHSINPREKKQLDDLERELARVVKAKETVGEKYVPRTGNQNQSEEGRKTGVLGKRSRDRHDNGRQRYLSPPSSDTDSDVGSIPMPRDTPPPIPRRRREDGQQYQQNGDRERVEHGLPDKPAAAVEVPSQAVYESKPVMRDLRKEAAAFVPAAVRKRKIEAEAEGGAVRVDAVEAPMKTVVRDEPARTGPPEQSGGAVDAELRRLQEEEERWRQETKQVTVEDVEDEDA